MISGQSFLPTDGPRSGSTLMVKFRNIPFWILGWIALKEFAAILAVAYSVSAWYPPAAISLVVAIRYGLAGVGAIFLANFVTSIADWSVGPDIHNIAASLAHAGAYGVAALFYHAGLRRGGDSLRPATIFRLIAAAFIGAALAAVLGALNHHVQSGGAHDFAFDRLFGWCLGDFFGAISLAPFLLFIGSNIRPSRLSAHRLAAMMKAPVAALAIAIALAMFFAVVARSADVDFRLVTVVGVGVCSVIVAHVVSPRSTLIYLFVVSILSAVWLSTEVAPAARMEFGVQIVTFLIASYTMVALSMDRMRLRAAGAVRRLRIRDLASQRDALERRAKVIEGEFAQLAHELRTPLGGIIGLLAITEGGVVSGRAQAGDAEAQAHREQLARYFKHMRGCALYLNALVDDAFDVARLSRDGFEPVIAEVSLAETIEHLTLVSLSKGGAPVKFPEDAVVAPLRVRTDRTRLLQILVNLLVNAARYSDGRGPVRVCCEATRQDVVISVRNTSDAVTKADLDGYIRGGGGPSDNSQGLGIGLPLVGRLCAGLGARLSTEVSGGVVTISVSVPRA
jgi:signal transduction histidine kinase